MANTQYKQLKSDKRQALLRKLYQKDPMLWLKERLGESPTDFKWSLFPEYKEHAWDGNIDPLCNAWREIAKFNWVAIEAATGCHAKGQLILMFDGSLKKVEDIQEGDLLMGDDSTPRKVLSLARGNEMMVRITPTKGESFEVNESHILSLKHTCPYGRYKNDDEIVNVSVREWMTWNKSKKHLYKLYRTSVEFIKEDDLPFDPYLMGLWIGDGSMHRFGISKPDIEIRDYVHQWAGKNNYSISINHNGDGTCPTYFIHRGYNNKENHLWHYTKKNFIVNGEKRIPRTFLTASREDRLKLLAGIIDTDGGFNCNCLVSTKWENLANDIAYLARSLGYSAYVKSFLSSCQGMKEKRTYYRISISGDLSKIPMAIERKIFSERQQKKRVTLTSFKVEHIGNADYYGFELDKNHLYLMGDFTVTHNTSKTYWLSRVVMWFLDVFEDSLVITSAPKQDQLKLNLWAEITKEFHKFKRLRPSAELLSLRLKVDGRNSTVEETEADLSASHHAIGFVAGHGSEEQSATKAQGFHREVMLIICEECPGMAQAVLTAFQNTCTGSKNVMLAVGNPDHSLDPLHTLSEQDNVKSFRISALDFPNVVLKREIFPGAVSIKSIERRKLVYGENSNLFLSRVRGISPASSADSLIKLEWIEACLSYTDKYKELGDIQIDKSCYNALGMDVANSEEGDKASLAWGKQNRLLDIHEFYCNNTNDLALNVIYDDIILTGKGIKGIFGTWKLRDMDIHPSRVGVDAVGVGAGTINTFKAEGYEVTALHGGQWDSAIPLDDEGKPMYEFNSLRAQMYFTCAMEMRDREFIIDIQDGSKINQLKKELIAPKLMVSGQKIAVESKESIKKRIGYSPNMMDSFVYWNWMRKNREPIVPMVSWV